MGGLMKFLKFVLFKIRCKRVVNIVAGSDRYTVVSEQKSNVTRFYWDQIESFTKNFSVVIGYGGFSTVYLAEKLPLAASTTCAAVKVQFCSSERLNRAHKQELEILLHLNHPHIVKLIGYCDDHEEGVLLFQYAPNGNLEEKLRESKKILSWRRRMIIAFQLAQAMEYLHIKQIVHGDIKASNILLDENLNCKLCDFGSAKMGFSSTILSPPADSPFTRSKNRIMMTGSPGYIDPHYLRTGLATKINDVYSFGIILLELLTGIEAFSPSNGGRLITRAQPMLQDVDKVVEMMDPRLPERGRHEVEARIMTALAATCLCDSPSFRPSSSDILKTMRDKISSISFFVGEKERSSIAKMIPHTHKPAMLRERVRRVVLAPAKENIEKIKKVVEDGNSYGAQQMYKSFGARYTSSDRYSEALDILHAGACLQLENAQVTCGTELAVLFVETLVKGKIPYHDDILDRIRKIYKKFPRIPVPQHLDLADDDDMQRLSEALGAAKIRMEGCSSFLKAAIKWSIEFGSYKHGSPDLHDMLADYIYSESPELDMTKVSYYFVRGKNPKKFASTLVNFMGKCYPGEDDLAIARAVLMYLSFGNLRDANALMDDIKKQVQIREIEFPDSELMQFINYLLPTLQRDALPLFNMLRQRYNPSISREPIFSELLDEVAEKFYGVRRRNAMPGGMFGELFKMMSGE